MSTPGENGVPEGAKEVCAATPALASLKVVPSSAAEGQEANFPRNLHNAAELFLRAGLAQNARRCIQRCSALLEVLKEGPDGKRSHSMGRGAVCWQCGHCGLPANAAECSETDIKPAPKCGACKSDAQTNFIKVVAEDGSVCPWIELKEDADAPQVTDSGKIV